MAEPQELKEFLAQFNFQPAMRGFVGIERERFLMTPAGVLVPRAQEFLATINDVRWTYELSACQVEDRTRPQKDLSAIKLELLENDNLGKVVADRLGLRLIFCEVAPDDMPLDVYPDARYLKIVKTLPPEVLRAACQVTGTHLHFGVASLDEALEVYNGLIPYLEDFGQRGDHSEGARLRIYKVMAKNWQPLRYGSAEDFFETAKAQGFARNPRNCWHLIRISRHGTIELRMFGVTPYLDEVISWVAYVRKLCGDKE